MLSVQLLVGDMMRENFLFQYMASLFACHAYAVVRVQMYQSPVVCFTMRKRLNESVIQFTGILTI